MPLPTFKTQAEIPEAFRSEYIEKDGQWIPKPGEDAPDVTKLLTGLESERQARKTEKARADAAERERDELKRANEARDKGISAEELKKIQDAEALARKPIEEERDRLAKENRQLKLTDRVKALALANGVLPDRITKAMKDLEGRLDLADDGSTIVVKDAAGNLTADTVENFLSKTYKAEAPFFYAGTGGSGSGGTGGAGSGTPDEQPKTNTEREAQYRREIASSF